MTTIDSKDMPKIDREQAFKLIQQSTHKGELQLGELATAIHDFAKNNAPKYVNDYNEVYQNGPHKGEQFFDQKAKDAMIQTYMSRLNDAAHQVLLNDYPKGEHYDTGLHMVKPVGFKTLDAHASFKDQHLSFITDAAKAAKLNDDNANRGPANPNFQEEKPFDDQLPAHHKHAKAAAAKLTTHGVHGGAEHHGDTNVHKDALKHEPAHKKDTHVR